MEPDKFLEQGARVLADKLGPLGYEFGIIQPSLKGSGGPFAWAAFKRGNREIKLWARFGRLGSVHYRLGDDEFTHQDYMRALGLEMRRVISVSGRLSSAARAAATHYVSGPTGARSASALHAFRTPNQ